MQNYRFNQHVINLVTLLLDNEMAQLVNDGLDDGKYGRWNDVGGLIKKIDHKYYIVAVVKWFEYRL